MLRFISTTQGVNALSSGTAQGVIAVSSGESEFYALVKGAAAGLGAVSMLRDFGVDINKNTKIAVLEVRVDASAGRGIAVGRGAGRIRHVATPSLRVQKLTQDGIVGRYLDHSRQQATPVTSLLSLLRTTTGSSNADPDILRRGLQRVHAELNTAAAANSAHWR